MNRVLQFLSPCSCCRELRAIEAKLDRLAIDAERIEQIAGTDVLEFWLPEARRVLNPKPDDGDETGIRLMVAVEPRLASLDESLAQYAIDELRRIGAALLDAADLVEGGAA